MKNILVVGGTKGICKEVVQLLSDSNVFVIARTKSDSPAAENQHFIKADISQNSFDWSQNVSSSYAL